MKRRKATQKTPLKQTRISSFFQKGDAKRLCVDNKSSPSDAGSPDVILCTPPDVKETIILRRSPRKSQKPETKLTKGKKNLFKCTDDDLKDPTPRKVCPSSNKQSDIPENIDLMEDSNSAFLENTPPPSSEPQTSHFNLEAPPKKPFAAKDTLTGTAIQNISKKKPPAGERSSKGVLENLLSSKNSLNEPLVEAMGSYNLKVSKDTLSSANGPSKNQKIEEIDFMDDLDCAFFENTPPTSSENQNSFPKKSTDLIKAFTKSPKKVLQVLNTDNTKNEEVLNDFVLDDFVGSWSPIKQSLEFQENWSPLKQAQDYHLDFTHCISVIVVSAETRGMGRNYEQVLIVKDKSSNEMGRVVLRDMWAFGISVSAEDDLSVVAKKIGDDWIVDAQNGYICLFPDLMISSTSLVGAMFCRRRGVLSNIFKGLDSDNKIMTMGSLVHELLQKALQIPLCTRIDLENIVDGLLINPPTLRMLYSCGMTMDGTRLEINHFIPFILNFLKTYVTQEEKPVGNNFTGVISDVVDIEESVTSSKLGIRGRVDVTVQVKLHGATKLMPLELKTGRASFSSEHRSQVILYTMMMSDLGKVVESGLLLYIKEGLMEEIKPSPIEIRDLILLRNDFAKYLRRFDSGNLPEPIRMVNACKRCPYLTVCSAFLDESVSETHPLRSLDVFIEPAHLEYFYNWSKLLVLEDSSGFEQNNDVKLIGCTLEEGVVRLKSEFKYTFKRNDDENVSLTAGNFVNVLTHPNPRSYRGRIIQMSSTHCSVLLEKELNEKSDSYSIEAYRLTMLSRYMTNIGLLLEEPHAELRKIIIDLQPAHFAEKLEKSTLSEACLEILKALNEEQRRAVLKVLTSQNYVLIEGPPGTGKTQTIVALVKVLLILNQNVLLVGHTHSSVDNILRRLPDVEFLRMGSLTNIHESLHAKTYAKLSQALKNVNDVENLLNRSVIASTCLGLDADIIAKRKFDVCIVDESSQVLQPEVLKPLFASKKFVLIGDPKQLRPVVKSIEAKQLGMGVSIFERLSNSSSVVTLTHQYRMNSVIMDLANHLTYEGVLRAGSKESASKVLSFDGTLPEKWLNIALSSELGRSAMFLDTSKYLVANEKEVFSCVNPVEVEIIRKLVDALLKVGVSADRVGIMAPFRAQIQKLLEALPSEVEVNTVDQYQGRDKDVVIFSCTRQDPSQGEKGEHELLNDERRLTVALTRAKCKLIMVGDKDTLVRYKTFERLFGFFNVDNILLLEDGVNDFHWPILA